MRRIEEAPAPLGAGNAVSLPALSTSISAAIFVVRPSVWQRHGTPGGLALLDRQLKQLRALAVESVVLLVPTGDPEPVVASARGAVRIVRVPRAARELDAALAAAVAELPLEGFALAADRLVDLRVLRALQGSAATTFASVDGSRPEPVAWVRVVDVRRYGEAVAAHARRLPLAALDPYSPELRGTMVPYVVDVSSESTERRAWDLLLDSVQKRSLDLPGQYFDTPFENALVRRLAPTDVTPNQVTLATLGVAAVVAYLFSEGWLRLGVMLALVVGVLDGVDGKLARMKLATSKLGELEHIGDFLYENAWYLSLAAYFSGATGWMVHWYAGLTLVACDLADSLLYLVAKLRTGRMLDELTPFDRRFRAIAGRRNVYVMTFVVGFFAGEATTAFLVAVAWAIVTVAVHALRVTVLLRARASPAKVP